MSRKARTRSFYPEELRACRRELARFEAKEAEEEGAQLEFSVAQ